MKSNKKMFSRVDQNPPEDAPKICCAKDVWPSAAAAAAVLVEGLLPFWPMIDKLFCFSLDFNFGFRSDR